MDSDAFVSLAASCHAAGVPFWTFADAPPEFQTMSIHGGKDGYVFYVPADILDEGGELDADDRRLWFLDWLPKYPEHVQYAGNALATSP